MHASPSLTHSSTIAHMLIFPPTPSPTTPWRLTWHWGLPHLNIDMTLALLLYDITPEDWPDTGVLPLWPCHHTWRLTWHWGLLLWPWHHTWTLTWHWGLLLWPWHHTWTLTWHRGLLLWPWHHTWTPTRHWGQPLWPCHDTWTLTRHWGRLLWPWHHTWTLTWHWGLLLLTVPWYLNTDLTLEGPLLCVRIQVSPHVALLSERLPALGTRIQLDCVLGNTQFSSVSR